MTDWHEDSAARSRRLRGEKTVEQRLADIEARLDALESPAPEPGARKLAPWWIWNTTEPMPWDGQTVGPMPEHTPDHDPLGR
jgi:hypothetical protein